VTLNIGLFINTIISFIIIAFAVFEVDPVFLDTGLGDNQWSRRSGEWQVSVLQGDL